MPTEPQSGDRLLWLAAGAVGLMGLGWLLVEAPWSAGEPPPIESAGLGATGETARPPAAEAPDRAVADPLRMAQMALAAGMLTEPPAYSAWTLFGDIVASEPDNAAAQAGLDRVVVLLLQRGDAALEQGRYDDANAIAGTIVERLPDHTGALALSARIAAATAPPPPPAAVERTSEPEPARRVDPIPELHAAFREAMIANDVLRPEGRSAIDVVTAMIAAAPDHELTFADRDMLITEMLDRSQQSIEALDSQAAQTWIDATAPLEPDPDRIAEARERLTQHMIAMESEKILPASALIPVETAQPEFPQVPLKRGIEGWVEVEFFVSPDGTTDRITIIDASHSRYFREEAIAAIRQWRFEPVTFMGRPIPQKTFTRLEFVLD
jgi:protein TonB